MFTNEETAEDAKYLISYLAADPEVAWFVDANVVISGEATKVLGEHRRLLSTPDVATEVRKRPESKTANQLITRIEQNGGLVTREMFADSTAGFDMLVECAKRLTPGVQIGKRYFMREMGMTEEAAEVRAIEGLANAGQIFKCDMMDDGVERGLFSREQATIDKGTRRSWYRYPAKRRRQAGGEYRFSDETLLAVALSNTILHRQKTCVLSNDTDCMAIMKQLTDNLLWVVTSAEFKAKGVDPNIDEFNDRWRGWCQHVDESRRRTVAKRNLDLMDAEDGPPVPFRFTPDEMMVCRLTDLVASDFSYPPGVSEFVRTIRGEVRWADFDEALS